jgi:hypothetical protein
MAVLATVYATLANVRFLKLSFANNVKVKFDAVVGTLISNVSASGLTPHLIVCEEFKLGSINLLVPVTVRFPAVLVSQTVPLPVNRIAPEVPKLIDRAVEFVD